MQQNDAARPSLGTVLLIGVWFGIVTGLVEGLGLLLFQRLNGEDWALHVSAPIIWISALVDLVLFAVLALLVAGITRPFPRLSAVRATGTLLTSLAIYDFLTLTARLTSLSRILLALGTGLVMRRWLLKHETVATQFWKKTLPWVAVAGLLALVCIPSISWLKEHRALSQLPPATPGSPNVLVIVVDTLRADHLSAYGYSRPTSPNIDRLAREGVMFDNAISTCSWTYPSHVSLVTGRYQFEHGTVQPEAIPLFIPNKSSFGGYPTIGEVLQQRGYRTGAFSANRFYFAGNMGFHRGFIHFEDYYYSTFDRVSRTLPGKEFVHLYWKWFRSRLTADWLSYGTRYGLRKRGDEVNREFLRWIDRSGSHPFFAFLNYLDAHGPYGVPSLGSKFSGGTGDVDGYDDGVRYDDDQIGRLLHGLEQRGLLKNTLVVITSDHGESLGEHGFTGHGRFLYWDQIHVPLVVWYPGRVPSGVRISRPVTNVAIPATILELLAPGQDRRFRGPSLDLLWKQPEMAATWPDPLAEVAEDHRTFPTEATLGARIPTSQSGPLKALITSRWHLIIHKKFGNQIYDWVSDPAEANNLISTPAGKEATRDLMSRMNDILAGVATQDDRVAPVNLPMGTSYERPQTSAKSPARLNDYYRIQARPGSRVTIEVGSPDAKSNKQLDPLLTLADGSGRLYQSCRNPGDDHVQTPGIADSTPEVFDDLCVNDDIVPGVNTNSRLEILVPGQPGSWVDLYARVSDWNGKIASDTKYHIAVSSPEGLAHGGSAH